MSTINNNLVFATSFGPKNIERTQECINSWRKYGLEIYSIQLEEEAEYIKNIYSGINIISTSNSGSSAWSKKTPNILELINLTRDSDVIIINSDIEITYSLEDFHQEISLPNEKTFLCGIRYNKNENSSVAPLKASWWEPYGIDLFRIPKGSFNFFKNLEKIPFAIGMPGWDFWLPYFLHTKGFEFKTAKMTTNLLHKNHGKSWDEEDLILASIFFKRYLSLDLKKITTWVQDITNRKGWDFNMAYSREASIIESKDNSSKEKMSISPMIMAWPPSTRKSASKLRQNPK